MIHIFRVEFAKLSEGEQKHIQKINSLDAPCQIIVISSPSRKSHLIIKTHSKDSPDKSINIVTLSNDKYVNELDDIYKQFSSFEKQKERESEISFYSSGGAIKNSLANFGKSIRERREHVSETSSIGTMSLCYDDVGVWHASGDLGAINLVDKAKKTVKEYKDAYVRQQKEKIIREKRPDALETFKENIIPERQQSYGGVKKYQELLKDLDENGYFESVFLPELTYAGPRLQEHSPTEGITDIGGFIGILEYLIKRETGDESGPLVFNGKIFRVWFILIAKYEKIMAAGASPYLNRAKQAISQNYDSIYLMTRGENIKFLKPVIDAIKEQTNATFKWKKSFKTKFTGKRKAFVAISLFRV